MLKGLGRRNRRDEHGCGAPLFQGSEPLARGAEDMLDARHNLRGEWPRIQSTSRLITQRVAPCPLGTPTDPAAR